MIHPENVDAAYIKLGHICPTCNRDCDVAPLAIPWQSRTTRICQELARTAGELLAPIAQTCAQWRSWTETVRDYLWETLWETPVQDVDATLGRAALLTVDHYVRNHSITTLCAAMKTHHPMPGEQARLPRPNRYDLFLAETCWVRCADHRSWCAVKTSHPLSRGRSRETDIRTAIAMHIVMRYSSSCDDFRARWLQVSNNPLWHNQPETLLWFAEIRRGKWVNHDSGGSNKKAVRYGAAAWAAIPPALAPWATIAASMLRGAK
jgi:hypothetical protein